MWWEKKHRWVVLGRRGRLSLATVTTAAVVAAATGCTGSPGGTDGGTRRGGTLVWAKPADATLLDPTRSNTSTSWELLRLTYENLVGLGDNLRVVPELATSWTQKSPTTYVFELRKSAKFSNGRAMTAADVVGSLRRLDDPKLAAVWASQLGIRSVSATGSMQVSVTLDEPKTSFLPALAGSSAAILPMKELSEGSFDPKKELLGTGPYKVVNHTQGQSWTFERNPYYWRPDLPKANRVNVRIMPDDSARIAALRDGSADVTTFEIPDAIRLLKGQANVKTVVQTTTDFYRLDLNARSSIFRDDRLRQAVALSIDRDRIIDVALGGVGKPTAAVSQAYTGICDPAQLPFARPDATRARQLVAAAGATGKTVEIIAPVIIPMSSPIAQILQQNLQAAGLKVRITPLEIGQVQKRAYTGKSADFDLVVSWFAGYADPAMTPVRWNPELTGYNKPWMKPDRPFYKLLDEALTTPPGAKRTATLREICSHIAQSANIIPLVTKDSVVAYRTDRVVAPIRSLEGYAVPLRNLSEFAPTR